MTAAWHPTFVFLQPEMLLAQAWVTAAEGCLSEALSLTRQAAEVAGTQHQLAVEVFALHTAVCFGDRTVADRLAELAAQVDGPRGPAAAAHAAAFAADDAAGLLAASVQLETMGALLLAAVAAARHRARGAAQAAFADARAARLAHRCEDVRTPALLAGTAPLPISTREREVATMVATGLSNKEIAARLHVSVRTVEGHIYRACTRLGVTDRTALATLFTDPTAPNASRPASAPATGRDDRRAGGSAGGV